MSSIKIHNLKHNVYTFSIIIHPTLNNNGINHQIGLCGMFRCKILKIHYATSNVLSSELVAGSRTRVILKSDILQLRYHNVENTSSTLTTVNPQNNQYIQFLSKLATGKHIEYDIGLITINNYIDLGFFLADTTSQDLNFAFAGVDLELTKID